MTAAIPAKQRPYASENVVDKKRGEYDSYAASSNRKSGVKIFETLYVDPVLSYELESLIGR